MIVYRMTQQGQMQQSSSSARKGKNTLVITSSWDPPQPPLIEFLESSEDKIPGIPVEGVLSALDRSA